MKEIKLTQGKVAFVDDEDYEVLNQWKWYAHNTHGIWYAYRNTNNGKKRTQLLMQRVILQTPIGMQTDHINHNGLDNRRANLRACTPSDNQHNRLIDRDKTSQLKGIYWNKKAKKWIARITFNMKLIQLGRFDSDIEAAKAYDQAAINHYGQFARTNFIEGAAMTQEQEER